MIEHECPECGGLGFHYDWHVLDMTGHPERRDVTEMAPESVGTLRRFISFMRAMYYLPTFDDEADRDGR